MNTAAPTQEQIDFLLTFLEKYTPLARGYLRSAQNRVRGKKLWEELTRKLNALGGATKTTKQWQKVWADKKYLVKKAVSASKESGTDGGPSSATVLTETELRIVNLIGQRSWESDYSMSVQALPTLPIATEEVCLKTEEVSMKPEEDSLEDLGRSWVTDTPLSVLTFPPLPIVTEEVCLKTDEVSLKTEEDSLESDADSLESDEASIAASPVPGPQRRHRMRQRQTSQEGGFRSRLFRMEEARLAAEELQAQELGAIRRSLETLVNLMQTYMQRE